MTSTAIPTTIMITWKFSMDENHLNDFWHFFCFFDYPRRKYKDVRKKARKMTFLIFLFIEALEKTRLTTSEESRQKRGGNSPATILSLRDAE